MYHLSTTSAQAMLGRSLLLVVLCVSVDWAAEATTSKGCSSCPLEFISFDSSCYLFSNHTASYGQAMSFCKERESRLAEINSKYEEDLIRDHLNTTGGGYSYYIGGTDLDVEGIWTWENPVRNISYLNWYPGEPNNKRGNEHCLDLFTGFRYRMNDCPCKTTNRFVCEKQL